MDCCSHLVKTNGGNMTDIVKKQDSNGNDNVIARLGHKYSDSLLSGKCLWKTSLELTEKTLSGIGRTYASSPKKVISFSGNVKDISSIGFDYCSNWILLLVGILTLPLYGLGIIFLIIYSNSKTPYIVVNFQGAKYALSLKEIPCEASQKFIEKVLNIKKL